MALYQFVCSVAVVVVLSANGCYSRHGECGKMAKGHHPKVLPWLAVIEAGDQTCFGVLVSDQWVLTTMNCGHRSEHGTIVSLGRRVNQTQANQTQTNQTQANQTDHWSFVKRVKCSNDTQMNSGLCLLELSKRVNFTDTIQPICLASKDSILHSGLQTYILTGAPGPALFKVPLVGPRQCQCHYPERSRGMICSRRVKHDKKDEDMMGGDMMGGDMMGGDMMGGDMMGGDMMGGDMMGGDMMGGCQSGMGAVIVALQDETWTLLGVAAGDQICEPSNGPLFFTPASRVEDIMGFAGSGDYSFNTLGSDGSDPDRDFECTRECPFDDPELCDDSIFTGGANMTPSSPFVVLCVLALSFFFTKW